MELYLGLGEVVVLVTLVWWISKQTGRIKKNRKRIEALEHLEQERTTREDD